MDWQKTYGGTGDDYANSIQQTSDGGYIVAGTTNSFGAGGFDAWILKLDSLGNISGCSGLTITETNIAGIPSTATVTSTAIQGVNTSVTPVNSNATITTPSFSESQVCSGAMDNWAILNDLYNSLGGADWTNNTGWGGAEGTECKWYGVTCDGSNKVIQLDLSNNKLSGTIPSSLGNLTNLQILISTTTTLGIHSYFTWQPNKPKGLDLYNNRLSGSIPTSLGNLTNLTYLNLYNNQLSGPIPPELGNLTNLQNLYCGITIYRDLFLFHLAAYQT